MKNKPPQEILNALGLQKSGTASGPETPRRMPYRQLSEVRFDAWPEWQHLREMHEFFGDRNPYELPRDGRVQASLSFKGTEVTTFCSYNYIGLNGHATVNAAVARAATQYGTSASASRVAGGECRIHRELEAELADFVGSEAAITTVGGYVANVATLRFVIGPEDLVIYDEFCHHSLVEGCLGSGARRMQFRHSDYDHLASLLATHRREARRVLIVAEGVYGMDGDLADLPRLLRLKRQHKAFLMLDEAHSIGTVGATGRGLCERQGCDPRDVDILMLTLSKSFASCGGAILGSRALTDMLRYHAPGFHLYSAGIPPTACAAALEALRVLRAEPERLQRLAANADHFRESAVAAGLDIGLSEDTPVVPVMVGSVGGTREGMAEIMRSLLAGGVHVAGLAYPVVPRDASRLRFFITSEHTASQIDEAVALTARVLASLEGH